MNCPKLSFFSSESFELAEVSIAWTRVRTDGVLSMHRGMTEIFILHQTCTRIEPLMNVAFMRKLNRGLSNWNADMSYDVFFHVSYNQTNECVI